jgi:hypothetical protein
MATKTGAQRHTHKYHNIAGRWHCALPKCTHFMPGNVADNINGKESICWMCNRVFILDETALEHQRPICIECRNPEDAASIEEFLKAKNV